MCLLMETMVQVETEKSPETHRQACLTYTEANNKETLSQTRYKLPTLEVFPWPPRVHTCTSYWRKERREGGRIIYRCCLQMCMEKGWQTVHPTVSSCYFLDIGGSEGGCDRKSEFYVFLWILYNAHHQERKKKASVFCTLRVKEY